MEKFKTEKSKALFEQTRLVLVDGVASSFHKAADEDYPVCLERGYGSKVYDVDGNEYIDYIAAFGPMLLGYCPDAVNQAVIKQLAKGSQLAAATPELYRLSKLLTEIIPCAEKVSYQNSGTEANLHAFRLARAYTGKQKLIKFEGQYHGWADEEKVSIDADSVRDLGDREAPRKLYHSKGQRQETADDVIILPWNDLALLEQVLSKQAGEIAAIITEPIMCDSGPILPQPGYLAGLRELATRYRVVLIFDEVITGFRVALGGAQQYYQVVPDLAVFAKAIAGGYPFAAIAGKRAVMDAGVHASGTFNGNPVGVAAALATLETLQAEGVYERLEFISRLLTEGITALACKYQETVFCTCIGSIGILVFGMNKPAADFREFLEQAALLRYQQFVKKAREYGVRFTARRGRIYLSTQHTEADIQKTLQVIEQVFAELQGGL
jgi:glutamate-1-semialdehyde 2,1-aminomutase